MPTTKYDDDNLSFLPSQQWNQHNQYLPGPIYPTVPTGASSSHGSSSSEYESSAPEGFCESYNSPLRSPDTTTTEDAMALQKPYLQFVEPPVETLRFRYRTELKGTHGPILGISTTTKKENSRKRTFPSVKLCNYNSSPDKKVIIRCTLTTADDDIKFRVPHVHLLKGKGKTQSSKSKTVEVDDPIDIQVSSPHYQAVFGNMTILFVKKDEQLNELVNKKKRNLHKMFVNPYQKVIFTENDEKNLLEGAQREVESMNLNRLNTACLKFEAFEASKGQMYYNPICPPLYTNPIKNIKSPQFNDLKICRIDKVAGTCLGREEVFIFVDKVNRKDVRVRFFELDDNEQEVWQAEAEMNEDDVHYQYGIAFRTPRYRNTAITDNVKVYFQLERPSNGTRSLPKEFEYTPDPNRWRDEIRKRPRRDNPPIPTTVSQFDMSRPSTGASIVTTPCLGSMSSVTTGSETSPEALNSENSLSGFSDLLKDFDLHMEYSDLLNMDAVQEGAADIPSAHSSLLSNIPSGDSDVIRQMLKSDAFNKWGRCNGIADSDIAHIKLLEEFETDGARSLNKEMVVEPQSDDIAQFEMWLPPHSRKKAPPQPPKEPGMGKEFQMQDSNQKRLSRENIIPKVVKLISGVLCLKKSGKIKEIDFKRLLQVIFGTCVGVHNDRVLHILASNQDFPPEMLRFLNVLNTCNVAETVINLKNDEGQTALHVAVEKGNLQTISLLVDNGADVNARDNHFNTPIHLVANRGQKDVCHVIGHIFEKKPDVNIYNKDGLTALHVFVINNKFEAISSLMVKNETMNCSENMLNLPDRKRGNTALHMAVQNKCLDTVGLLLHLGDGIDVNAKNNDGKTPLAYVSSETNVDVKIEELLLKYKADPLLAFPKINTKSDKLKINDYDEDYEDSEDEVQIEEDVDESLSSHAQDWKSAAELKLMDKLTISPFCQVLDENGNWANLYESIASIHPLVFQDDFIHQLKTRWSPTLYLLKFVAKELPSVTKENLRDILMEINVDCRKAAQFIDDMVLQNMGVF